MLLGVLVGSFVGAAVAAAASVPLSELALSVPGGAATLTAQDWSVAGPSACAPVRPSTTLTGTATLTAGPGGAASFVFTAVTAHRDIPFSGTVAEDGPTTLTIDLPATPQDDDDGATLTGYGTTFTGPVGVSTKEGCRYSTSDATLTLAGSGLTLTTPIPPGATELGGVSVAGYCQSTSGTTYELVKGGVSGPDFAYDNWQCGSTGPPASMTAICRWQYPTATHVVAITTDPDNAESWVCYGDAAVVSTSTTTTTVVVPPPSTGSTGSAQDVAPIARLGTPAQVFGSPVHDLLVALATVGIMLFIAFPANIFNQTFQEHYEEIMEMLGRAKQRARSLLLTDRAHGAAPAAEPAQPPAEGEAAVTPRSPATPRPTTWGWFALTLVGGALLGGLLKPSFGFNLSSLEDVFSTLLAFAFGAVVSWFVARAFRRHHRYAEHTYLRALPLGLGIAAACVLVSRLSNFAPGYLYGIVVAVAFVETMSDRHTAHLTALSALSTLTVAVAAWLIWIPVNHLAKGAGSNGIEVVLDDMLASIFVGGLVGTVVNLLPLRGLPGGTLVGWRRDAWAAVCFVALFLLVDVELAPDSGPSHPGGAPVVTAVVLFLVFGGLSFGFREYFRRREQTAAVPAAVDPGIAAGAAPEADGT